MIQKVLEPEQVKKFWKWTDKNRKSINLMKYAKEKITRSRVLCARRPIPSRAQSHGALAAHGIVGRQVQRSLLKELGL